jgi:hypothetical protein
LTARWADAVRAFELAPVIDWAGAVNALAELHCAPSHVRRVA